MNRYSIQEFAKRSGVSADTLRFYEKKNLLTPSRDEHNRYRYYTDYDLLELQGIYYMRGFSNSLSDIQPKKRPFSIDKQIHMVQQEIELLTQRINELQILRNRISRTAVTLSEIKNGINICKDYPIKPRYVLYYDDDCTPDHALVTGWMQFMPRTVSLLTIPKEALCENSTQPLPVKVGMQIVEHFADPNQVILDPPVRFYPASAGIRCMICLRDPLHPTTADFTPIFEYLRAHSLKPARDWTFGIRSVDEDEQGRLYYMSVLLAVEPA